MLFIANVQGTITAVVPEPIYRGSSNANELVLIAPFPADAVVYATFRLPNGQYLKPYLGTDLTEDEEKALSLLPEFSPKLFDSDGNAYNAWRIVLDAPITQLSGDLSVQFFVTIGSTRRPTSLISVAIGEGNAYVPVASDATNWNGIIAALSAAQSSAAEAAAEALKAEGYAVGTQNGKAVKSDSIYFKNNAKHFAEVAEDAKNAIGDAIDDYDGTRAVKSAHIYIAYSSSWENDESYNVKGGKYSIYTDLQSEDGTVLSSSEDPTPYVFLDESEYSEYSTTAQVQTMIENAITASLGVVVSQMNELNYGEGGTV